FTISITDISSREVWQQTISINGNKPYIKVLDLQGLNRGVYIIRIKGAGIVMNDKLIIN
ncbi:MAG: T9SS type A sorting domain-containing protein, partial [Pirellulales bacterium]|nr:T9SS type A sorting domain-containing protein [Pirellulales bacterium]